MYEDAARFYDVIHDARGRDPRAEADLVAAEVRRRTPGARTLLDVACGTGATLPRFAELFDVVGIDLSREMLAVAALRAPDVPLVAADMRTFDLGRRFDAIVCLFSSIGYLVEEADLHRAVATMAAHLEPGGTLLVEGWIEPEFWLGAGVMSEAGRDSDLAVARVVRTEREGPITDIFMRYVAASPDGLATVDEHHRMRLADPAEFESAYRAVRLSFERLPHMLRPGRSAYVGTARAQVLDPAGRRLEDAPPVPDA